MGSTREPNERPTQFELEDVYDRNDCRQKERANDVHFFTHTLHYTDATPVSFHCPACGERDVSGVAWTERHNTRLLGIIPAVEERLYWVRGPCCERQLLSRVSPNALAELDADTIEARSLIADRVSPVKIALLVGAFVLSVSPVVGPVFLLLAWLPNGSSRLWFRVACRLCLLLHVVAMNLLVVIAMIQQR